MPTPTKGPRLGGSPAHQRHMLANLATALFEHGKITTTEARARRLRPVAERLITFAKRGDLHARRQVLATVTDRDIVHTLFTEIGPSFASRDGGYTRITKIGPRKGDNAPLAVIELVAEEADAGPRRRRARRAQPAARPRRSDVEAAPETISPEPAAAEPGVPEPGVPEPAAAEPAVPEAAAAEPAVPEAAAAEPAVAPATAAGDTTVSAGDSDTEPVRSAAGEPTDQVGSAEGSAKDTGAAAGPGDEAGSDGDQPEPDQPEDSSP